MTADCFTVLLRVQLPGDWDQRREHEKALTAAVAAVRDAIPAVQLHTSVQLQAIAVLHERAHGVVRGAFADLESAVAAARALEAATYRIDTPAVGLGFGPVDTDDAAGWSTATSAQESARLASVYSGMPTIRAVMPEPEQAKADALLRERGRA